jgi:hypothetical protein
LSFVPDILIPNPSVYQSVLPETPSAGYGGILVLHYQPMLVPPHQHKSSDVELIFMLDSIGCGESRHPTSNGFNRHVGSGKANTHLFNGI